MTDLTYGTSAVPLGEFLRAPALGSVHGRAWQERLAAEWTGGGLDAGHVPTARTFDWNRLGDRP